jgi:hypothetical protein
MFFLQPKSTAAFYGGSNLTFALRQSSPDIGHSYYDYHPMTIMTMTIDFAKISKDSESAKNL